MRLGFASLLRVLPTMLYRTSSAARVARVFRPRLTTYSTASQPRERGPVSQFYGTFTRPVFKCLLLSIFTYQLVYFGWAKLEQEEMKAERQAEISDLETQVEALQRAKKSA